MSTALKGTMRNVVLKVTQNDGSEVYEFQLQGDEVYTVCNDDRVPADGDQVLVFLYPVDSKWPRHAKEVVYDVPQRVLLNDNILPQ